ncbi:MAG: arginine--tRNA ligase, partial [Desulfatiglans sp.]|nr:arginine--tRNA ligase [Desulfatiglans sp.]
MNNKLYTVLTTTLNRCFDLGLLARTSVPNFVIEVPKNDDHGHLATNLPLVLAKSQKKPPLGIASVIVDNLVDEEDLLASKEIAAPGFINFRIRAEQWHRVLGDILELREDYGRSKLGNCQRVVVEFVSANPTGPLHIGHGRGAALGDTLCRVLSFCGYDLVREFYINDAGNQIRLLGESIFSRVKQIEDPEYPFPENGYHGEYITDLAGKIARDEKIDSMTDEEAIDTCSKIGKELILEEIKEDLSRFRVPFDVWYSETELFRSGLLEDTLNGIKDRGHIYEREGASWIRTSDFGDDKDRVIRKKDGEFTYFASDIAYHLEKRNRGFEKAINIWGADHHGYVPRIKAAVSAHGFPGNWLSVVL